MLCSAPFKVRLLWCFFGRVSPRGAIFSPFFPKLFLIDSYFMLNRSDNDRYYGKYVKTLINKNKHLQFIPTFVSKNIFDIK